MQLIAIGGFLVKSLIIFIFIILNLFITFYGIGPVIFADGSIQERSITLAIVLLLYVVLFAIFRFVLKKIK